ncbi:MAG: hypothetical protein JJT81_02845 [Rubellimicrobium sp.]|nr:hypothetical protein [Rubellimicrobium sp.]
MSESMHDLVVRTIAATRFPFPGQTTWPEGYVTHTNVPERRISIQTPVGTHFPDIVITDRTGAIREIGEAAVPYLAAGSALADNDTSTRVRHFFVYVPAGQEAEAQRLLDENGISYAGVRGFTATDKGEVGIVPFVTAGDEYDHQVTLPQIL